MGFSDDVRRLEEQLARERKPPPRVDTDALEEASGADTEPVGDGGSLGAGADVELGEDP
jgi:hypothetical protein